MRVLVLRFDENPEWLPSVSQDITDAIAAKAHETIAGPYELTEAVEQSLRLSATLRVYPEENLSPWKRRLRQA